MIAEVTEVQQVTTRSKGKIAEWETQEEIRKHATEWVQQANQRKVDEVKEQEMSPKELIRSTEVTRRGRLYNNVRLCSH